MGANGSLEYALTWKHWDMPAGVPICALRASGRRTSGKGFGGWPTPDTGLGSEGNRAIACLAGGQCAPSDATRLLGWSTPVASGFGIQDVPNMLARRERVKQRTGNGNGFGLTLDQQVALMGWATPRARDGKGNGVSIARAATGTCDSLDLQCKTVSRNGMAPPSPYSARTDGRALRLNPRFSLWLQGYPATWAGCAVQVTRSSRKSRLSL